MAKVYPMIKVFNYHLDTEYFICNNRVYLQNKRDSRPSAQIYVGEAEKESRQLSLFEVF